MKKPKVLILTISIFFHCFFSGFASQNNSSGLLEKLQNLPEVQVKSIEADSLYKEAFEVMLVQPLDHCNPEKGNFQQRIHVSHCDYEQPVVLVTEGYAIGVNYVRELSSILKANEVRVEHRYFGQSIPDTMDWACLNIRQSSEDYHRIVQLFKSIYSEKWISTGWSKGGQSSLYFRRFYPDDVDVTVAYETPLNFSQTDFRIDAFFETVGTESCRRKLIALQRLALKNKEELLPRFKWYAKGRGYTYSIGFEKAFEYIVLEYPFSFWQYHYIECDSIPGSDASPDQILEHLWKVVSFWSYSDHAMNSPSMYQFMTQLGYYGYVTVNVQDLLSDMDYPNAAFAPQNVDLTYDPKPMKDIEKWLRKHGDNILTVYGENDPWSAPQVAIGKKTNAKKFILKGGNHFTFINSFPEEERKVIISTIKEWLSTP
jgi:hypothetical protein